MKCGSVGTRPSGSCSPTGGLIRSPALVTTTRSARIGASVGLFRPCSGVVTVSASNPQPRRRPIKAVISEQTPQRSERPGTAGSLLLGRDRELVAEDVEGGVRLEALHALVVEREDRAPHRLHDRPVVLEDLLELRHDLAPGG